MLENGSSKSGPTEEMKSRWLARSWQGIDIKTVINRLKNPEEYISDIQLPELFYAFSKFLGQYIEKKHSGMNVSVFAFHTVINLALNDFRETGFFEDRDSGDFPVLCSLRNVIFSDIISLYFGYELEKLRDEYSTRSWHIMGPHSPYGE